MGQKQQCGALSACLLQIGSPLSWLLFSLLRTTYPSSTVKEGKAYLDWFAEVSLHHRLAPRQAGMAEGSVEKTRQVEGTELQVTSLFLSLTYYPGYPPLAQELIPVSHTLDLTTSEKAHLGLHKLWGQLGISHNTLSTDSALQASNYPICSLLTGSRNHESIL